MLETVTPVQFHAGSSSGKTKPSRVTCEKADGTTVEVMAKFSSGCDRREIALAMEVVAACLAGDLGLPIPQPYLLDVQQAWIRTVPDQERHRQIATSNRVAFGSTLLGSQFRAWSTGDKLSAAMLPDALGTFVFDAMIANPDRRLGNPNCLVKGSQIRIFDHELAFLHKGILGWREPWKMGALASMTTPGNHIFYPELKGLALDLGPVQTAWSGLNDARLQAYRNAVPAQWATAGGAIDDAIDLIKSVRDNVADAVAEVQRVLT